MNACITFGNTFGLDENVPGVSTILEDGASDELGRLSCVVDDACFETPADYAVYGMGGGPSGSSLNGGGIRAGNGAAYHRQQFSLDEEDELLQYAIQQSLLDVGSECDQVDIWEALKAERPSSSASGLMPAAAGIQQPKTPQPTRPHRSPLPPRPSSSLGFRLSPEEELLQR